MSTATTTTTNSCSQAAKFSRYRSVRRAAAVSIPEDVPPTPTTPTTPTSLSRAPSRYHRNSRPRTHTEPLPVAHEVVPLPNAVPVQRTSSRDQDQNEEVGSSGRTRRSRVEQPTSAQNGAQGVLNGCPSTTRRPPDVGAPSTEHRPRRSTFTADHASGSRRSYEAAREEARMILEGEFDRLQELKRVQTKASREPDRWAPTLKRHVTQVKPPQSTPVFIDAPKMSVKVKVPRAMPEQLYYTPSSVTQAQQPLLTRSSPPLPTNLRHHTLPKTAPKTQAAVVGPMNLIASVPANISLSTAPKQIDTPKFDAPVSAVNAGDRRVEIRFRHAEVGITLPVTPKTDPKDLLNSASVVMSTSFNPKTSILVESFSNLGLERPLRRYEHIRDVMNSWTSDDQNYLRIVTESEAQTKGLEQNEVLDEPPVRVMVQLHLSTRPGKWDKRYVILREDGQVTMSKTENDGEGTNICHLSDYDVYTPNEKQVKKLKPPKKICFAIKSQQKSAMFLEGTNYVHYFATSDKQVADRWYTAVQSWRSWYLVHMRGEGKTKPKANLRINTFLNVHEAAPLSARSTESVPYQLGSFKPLLDFSDMKFDPPLHDSGTSHEHDNRNSGRRPSGKTGVGYPGPDRIASQVATQVSGARNAQPCNPAKLVLEAETKGLLDLNDSDQGFTGGGLLGRSMTTRRPEGTRSCGHGVSGVNGKPLVNLAPTSEFADGSLLRQLEAWSLTQGESEPKIDRMKRVETNIRTGEGLY